MTVMKRVKKMFGGYNKMTDSMFESYYGSILRDHQEGGPNAAEARRDFNNLRHSVSRISVY